MISIKNEKDILILKDDENPKKFHIKYLYPAKELILPKKHTLSINTGIIIECTEYTEAFVLQSINLEGIFIYPAKFKSSKGKKELTLSIINILESDIILPTDSELCTMFIMQPISQIEKDYKTYYLDENRGILIMGKPDAITDMKGQFDLEAKEASLIITLGHKYE